MDRKLLPWPGMKTTTCTSCLSREGSSKEQRNDKLSPTRRIWEGRKRGRRCWAIHSTSCQPPGNSLLESVFTGRAACHLEKPWVRQYMDTSKVMGQGQPRNKSLLHKTQDWTKRQSSPPGFPDLAALHSSGPFSIVSCFISKCVSLDNSFPSVRQSPLLGPGRHPSLVTVM